MTRGMGGHSVSNITHHLKGIHFPAKHRDILSLARKNGADKDIMEILQAMPEQDYASVAEIMKAVGAVERGEEPGR